MSRHRQETRKTGGGPPVVLQLTASEQKVLDYMEVHAHECLYGIRGGMDTGSSVRYAEGSSEEEGNPSETVLEPADCK